MAGNIFGTVFRITTYGESHGHSIGVIIDGCPAGYGIVAVVILLGAREDLPPTVTLSHYNMLTANFIIASPITNILQLY